MAGCKSPNIIFSGANLDAAIQAAFWGSASLAPGCWSRTPFTTTWWDDCGRWRRPSTGRPSRSEDKGWTHRHKIESSNGSSTARLVPGGTRKIDGKGLFIEPTLFANATNDLKISHQEPCAPSIKCNAVPKIWGCRIACKVLQHSPSRNTWALQGGVRKSGKIGDTRVRIEEEFGLAVKPYHLITKVVQSARNSSWLAARPYYELRLS